MSPSTQSNGTSLAADLASASMARDNARREWRWALVLSLIIVCAGCLPYLVAWLSTPPGYQFGGILVNPLDGNSYLAKMRQGWDGAWLFHLTYTPEPHAGAAIFLFYLALGHLARLVGLPIIIMYHTARILGGLVMLAAIYAFVGRLSHVGSERRLLFVVCSATAGLGWLGSMLGLFPIDLWVPEAFAFFSLLTNPHFPLAIALMLVIVSGVLWPSRGWRCWVIPGLAGLALSLLAPFSLAVLYVTLLVWLLVRILAARLDRTTVDSRTGAVKPELRASIFAAVAMVVLSAPWVGYDLWVTSVNPAMAAWSAQNVTPTPPLADVMLGFGLLVPLAALGAYMVLRQRERAAVVLVLWAGLTVVLLYAPIALQRRLITGLGLPLALLAGLALSRTAGRWATLLRQLTVTFGILGSAFLLFVFTAGALGQRASDPPGVLYLSQDEAAGMEWLSANAAGEVVLASPRSGLMLPGRAGVRVFYGHPFETIDAATKAAQAEVFFRGQMATEEWQHLAAQYAIRYVFVGPTERWMGAGAMPNGLQPVFQQGEVTIYRLS